MAGARPFYSYYGYRRALSDNVGDDGVLALIMVVFRASHNVK